MLVDHEHAGTGVISRDNAWSLHLYPLTLTTLLNLEDELHNIVQIKIARFIVVLKSGWIFLYFVDSFLQLFTKSVH